MVELDLGHLEAVAPLGLVPQTILERTLGVFLGDEELYRFRVVKLGERIASPGTVFGYPRRSNRFKVSTPVFRRAILGGGRGSRATSVPPAIQCHAS